MNNIKNILNKIYNPLSRGNQIDIPSSLIDEYNEFAHNRYKEFGNSSRATNKRVFIKKNMSRVYPVDYDIVHKWLDTEYNINEKGIKWLASDLGYTYSVMRDILKTFNIEIRQGHNVMTKNLSKIRSKKSKQEYNNRSGWFSSFDRKNHHTQRGVCGYYWNKSRQKYVWLRSTWEYIYAKFLNNISEDWDTEVELYTVDGRVYRPDFFIYDNGVLNKIIEIKGYWRDKEWKSIKLNDILSVDVIVIDSIKKYISTGSNYNKELREWKQTRILNIKKE